MQKLQTVQTPSQKEELIVFRYKRDRNYEDTLDTLVFGGRSKRSMPNHNSIDFLTHKMSKISVDESIFCLKKVDKQIEPELQKLFFRTRDLHQQRRREIRRDLIEGLRNNKFPKTIKVCEIEDDWVPYIPANHKPKQKMMEVEPMHDYYILARDVLDQERQYQEVGKPKQVIDYIGESEVDVSDEEIDSEDSNREDNPDNDYPEEDYDYDEEEDQENYGEYNPYYSGEDDY